MLRALSFLLTLCSLAAAAERGFDPLRDTFAFSNDTVMRYGVDEQGRLHISRRDKPIEYGHRCFVLTRAVLQFHQFARFDPRQPKLPREEYHRRIRQLCRIPVWWPGARDAVVFPGFADLRSFSVAYEGLLKEDLGNWLPCYLRVGNWRMGMGHLRVGQAAADRWLVESMAAGKLRALYLARFPSMNHVVIAYAAHPRPNGDVLFDLYDPNYPQQPTWLRYRRAERSFEFAKRWYFPGGRVNVMRVYISPFH